jgi:hypothetical protein
MKDYDSHLNSPNHTPIFIRYVWSMKEFFKTISIITIEVGEFFYWPNAESIERPWGWNGSIRGRRGRGGAAPTRRNTNWLLTIAGGSAAPWSQSPDVGQSNRGRGTVRQRSTSPQTWQTRRQQTNKDVGSSERRLWVVIRGNQLYVERTHLNPRILKHPPMALRSMMPLRTIVDQILVEWWRERQPIVRANQECDCCVVP